MTEQTLPETQALIQVPGVGALTAVTFVLTVGDKDRFQKSRDVGSYIGLRPRRDQSGSLDPQLGESRKPEMDTCATFWSNARITSQGDSAKTGT